MGFFKDFKDDFSEAVNDLVPGAEELDTGRHCNRYMVKRSMCNPNCQTGRFIGAGYKESRRHTGRGGTGYSKTRKHSGGYSDNGNKRSRK